VRSIYLGPFRPTLTQLPRTRTVEHMMAKFMGACERAPTGRPQRRHHDDWPGMLDVDPICGGKVHYPRINAKALGRIERTHSIKKAAPHQFTDFECLFFRY